MRLFMSCNVTRTFGNGLFAECEQEEQSAFSDSSTENRVIAIQVGNFYILPFNSVKASGKSFTMVSGTATQSIIRAKTRRRFADGMTDEWLHKDSVECRRDRKQFIAFLHSEENKSILQDFIHVSFGTLHLRRNSILGI